MTGSDPDRAIRGLDAAELFESERSRLRGVAYRLLGTASDADDVVQEVFARWLSADRSEVDNPAAFLRTMTPRAAVDRVRSAQKQREVYVGPWLPEPMVTAASPADASTFGDPADLAELDESLSIGFLHLLERLQPLERACYLLHDVFDFSYSEIAAMVDRREDNSRQLASRGRSKLRVGHPTEVLPATSEQEDEVLGPLDLRFLRLNNRPGLLILDGEQPTMSVVFELAQERVHRIYAVLKRDKLAATVKDLPSFTSNLDAT